MIKAGSREYPVPRTIHIHTRTSDSKPARSATALQIHHRRDPQKHRDVPPPVVHRHTRPPHHAHPDSRHRPRPSVCKRDDPDRDIRQRRVQGRSPSFPDPIRSDPMGQQGSRRRDADVGSCHQGQDGGYLAPENGADVDQDGHDRNFWIWDHTLSPPWSVLLLLHFRSRRTLDIVSLPSLTSLPALLTS